MDQQINDLIKNEIDTILCLFMKGTPDGPSVVSQWLYQIF